MTPIALVLFACAYACSALIPQVLNSAVKGKRHRHTASPLTSIAELLLAISPARTVVPSGRTHSACAHARYPNACALHQPESEMVGACGGLLIVDHLNINHEAGRHDLLVAFYFDLLGCAVDPRKAQNLEKGSKTVWANAGIHQFHLSEGSSAQVFDGLITLAFADLQPIRDRLAKPPPVLVGSAFAWHDDADGDAIFVTDPWGSRFKLIQDATSADSRGKQPGPQSEPLAIKELLVHVPKHGRPDALQGIARFYKHVFGCDAKVVDGGRRVDVQVGGGQVLAFAQRIDNEPVAHEELGEDEEGRSTNHGAHVSMYVADLPSIYAKATDLGITYVNHRFKRRAYSLEEAVQQCMFRVIDVIDPDHPEDGAILRLEHEVRACITSDGSKYKSCPFFEIPSICAAPLHVR